MILGNLKYKNNSILDRANCGESRSLQFLVSIWNNCRLRLRLAIPCKTDLIDDNFFWPMGMDGTGHARSATSASNFRLLCLSGEHIIVLTTGIQPANFSELGENSA